MTAVGSLHARLVFDRRTRVLAEALGEAMPPDCAALIGRAIAPEPPLLVRDGGVIADGFDAELDELRSIQTNCDGFLLDLEARERTGGGDAERAAFGYRDFAYASTMRRVRIFSFVTITVSAESNMRFSKCKAMYF